MYTRNRGWRTNIRIRQNSNKRTVPVLKLKINVKIKVFVLAMHVGRDLKCNTYVQTITLVLYFAVKTPFVNLVESFCKNPLWAIY